MRSSNSPRCPGVSSTPTRATVDAYIRMGAERCPEPDPELFAREPEDIHLVLRLA